MTDSIIEKFAVVFGSILAALGIVFLFSYPLMLLWNGCMVPAITNLVEVTWLQMWGIAIVCSVLFKTSINTKKD